MRKRQVRAGRSATITILACVIAASAPEAGAQALGSIRGVVTRADSGAAPVSGVSVLIRGTALAARTTTDGRYSVSQVPAGQHTLLVRLIGHTPFDTAVTIAPGASMEVNVRLEVAPVTLGSVVVSTASRTPERIVEAPAAISIVPPNVLSAAAATGQAPLALEAVPGVDIVQNGVNDFNVNARGFNSSLSRRVLVLLDGRDLATVFLANQEWNALPAALDELGRVEMIRGPGSALYGANAFSGVLNLASLSPRDAPGTKVTVVGGELNTLRTDVRHAGLFGSGRFGYRLTGGYVRSDSWSISRTRLDSSDVVKEYAPATNDPVRRYREVRPLNGQTLDGTTRAALGDADPVVNAYLTTRLDYYAPGGAIGTLEGGTSEVRNETIISGIGRTQFLRARRPYARLALTADRYNLMAWYSGRDTREPQYTLGSGAALLEKSGLVHVEAQTNRTVLGDRGRFVAGVSIRNATMNTSNSLVAPEDDERSDATYSAYGQVEYDLTSRLRLVAAGRYDDASLFARQLSPKAALVFSLTPNQVLRATFNRAFQTPNYAEYFLRVPAGAPSAVPRSFETGLEGYFAAVRNAFAQAGAASEVAPLALPTDLPYNFAATTVVLALGNRNLDVERVTGYELGYKGEFAHGVFVTLDVFFNRKRDFVTDLAFGANPAYPSLLAQGPDVLTALSGVEALLNRTQSLSAQQKSALLASLPALRGGYNTLLSRVAPMPDGTRAIVLSYANAAIVDERGLELGLGAQLTDRVRADLNYAYFDFEVQQASVSGDQLLPNTPPNKGTLSVSYGGGTRFNGGLSLRVIEGYPWAAGVFQGFIPAQQTINANASYRLTPNVRLHGTATNLLDQQRFQLYGGSVIGRRILVGVTTTF